MAHLVLSFLGAFQATRDENAVVGFESNKVRALLVYLAVNSDQSHSREKLAGFLWPGRPEQVARSNLRQALANLRQTLGDETATAPYLSINRESVQFNRKANVYLDVQAFTSLMTATERHLHRREEACYRCAEGMREAVSVYRGNFLEHFSVNDSSIFEEWVLITRERLHQLAMKAFLLLSVYHELRGEYENSLDYARRLVEFDPWREEAHQQIIRALIFCGQRSAALAHYKLCQQVLEEELGVEPSEDTQVLYKQIKAGITPQSYACQPSRLPLQLTPFLGREEEVAAVTGLIEGPACRLVTLTGPGGIGKTRLALKVAEGQVGSFRDGCFFVPLASLHSGESLATAIAEAIGLLIKRKQELREQLLQHLRDKETLLVLDNFEHLLTEDDESTRLIKELLETAPQISLMVTSRERLSLRVENVFAIDGLAYPRQEDQQDIEGYSAVQLFLQQRRQVVREFSLHGGEASAVGQICRMVEGNPLAIEMAAGVGRDLSCRMIAERLKHGLQALVTTMHDVPERHRSIRAVFEHSWGLLSKREQQCLQRLSVFEGSFQRDAAVQVAGADDALLTALVDKSLLAVDARRSYSMHELFRQFAGEQLRLTGEEEAARDDYLSWFLKLAEEAEPALYSAPHKATLEQLEKDHKNLRTALQWAIDSGKVEAAAGLAGFLSRFWGLRGYLSEGRMWLDKVLAFFDREQVQATSSARARVLLGAGALAWRQGDSGEAVDALEASLAISEALRDDVAARRTLRVLATAESSRGNDERAIALLQECLESDRRLGDREGMAYDYGSLADSAYFQGNCLQAKEFYEASLKIHRERKDDYSVGVCLNNLGEVARVLGDYQGSANYTKEAISIFRQLEIKQSLASAIMNLGELEALLGDETQALAHYCEALEMQQALNAWGDIAYVLPNFAALALKAHESNRATCLYAAADAQREAAQIPVTPAQLAEYQENMEILRKRLGEKDFSEAWEAGKSMAIEEVINFALRRNGP